MLHVVIDVSELDVSGATDLPRAKAVALPGVPELELEPAMLPRDAFFAPRETVDAGQGSDGRRRLAPAGR